MNSLALVPRRATIGVGLLLLVAGALLVSPLADAWGDQAPPPVAAAVAADDPGGGGPALPDLGAAQKEEALTIARADPAVRPLLASRAAETLVVPWYTIAGDRLLGAGIDITWDRPAAVRGEWPTLFYDQTEQVSPPFLSTTATVEARDVTGVHIAVDLTSRKVVGMHPLPGAVVTKFKLDPRFRNTLPPQPKDRR